MKSRREDVAQEPAATSRRKFLKTIAAGTAATLAGNAAAAATKPPPKTSGKKTSSPAAAPPARAAAVEAEIKNQKAYTARSLKVIRDYPLPPGSEMAFTFVPMKAAPRDERSRR